MIPTHNFKFKDSAFTLVEVIIGMFVIAMALVGLLVMVSNSRFKGRRSSVRPRPVKRVHKM